jgi:hypothetical protein
MPVARWVRVEKPENATAAIVGLHAQNHLQKGRIT